MFISKCKCYLTHLFDTGCLTFNQTYEAHKKVRQKQLIAKDKKTKQEDSEMTQMLQLSDTDSKANMINMLKYIRKVDICRKSISAERDK